MLIASQLVRGYTLDLTSEGVCTFSPPVACVPLTPGTADSIRAVATDMTDDMMSFYDGNGPGKTPGLLPLPYYCMCW